MNYPPPYLTGIELFNQGHYWHAHEEWEEVWRAEQAPDRQLFYKGIIQTAAALVHWQRGNPRGLHRNWRKARPKLAAQPPAVLGLDIPALIDAMDRFEAVEGIGIAPPRLDLDPA
jgi:predicted metal-dependent hydrolase